MTIANPPYTGGDAAQWWRDLASVAVLIRQVFFTSPNVPQLHALGPVRASRSMRTGMRALVRRFTEIGIPASRVALELQFQSAPGHGRQGGVATALEMARDRQARGARGPSGDAGAEDALDLVVGLGDVQRGGHRPRQERGGLRLPLGARPEPLQRSRCRRAGLRSVAHRRAAEPACGGPVRAARRPDPVGRRRSARQGDRRSRHCRQSRARAARAPAGGRARRARRARSRAGVRRRSLSRQPLGVPRRAAEDPAVAERRARPPPRRAAARRRPRALHTRATRRPARSPSSTQPTAACGLAWSRRRRPVAWLGGRTRGLAIETFAPTRIFSLARPRASSGRSTGGSRCVPSTTPSTSARSRSPRPGRRSRPRSTASPASTPTRPGSRRRRQGPWRRPSAPATSSRRSAVLTLDDLLPFVTAPAA